MFSLEGKTALVTGASGGIGSSIAYALAKQGARLALSGSNSDKLRAFREQLNSEFGHDHVEITCDLSNAKQVEELIPATVDTLGSMNILVNNAGITRDNLFTFALVGQILSWYMQIPEQAVWGVDYWGFPPDLLFPSNHGLRSPHQRGFPFDPYPRGPGSSPPEVREVGNERTFSGTGHRRSWRR